ncbi:MAG: hypothetical protein Q9221_000451 [Calogaya cf. arnoldii]
MLRPRSYSPLHLAVFILLTTLTLAIDPPQKSFEGVTWLYPSLSVPSLTFNTLDTINVSWISHQNPASLKLTCQTNNYYTPALELPVPSTGNRLISLLLLSSSSSSSPSYQSCRFELSSPTKITTLPQSVSFNLTAIPAQEPAFWSLDSNSFSSSSSTYLDQKAKAEEARCKNKNTSTSAMAAIGVGVAVGVFALTTACFVLYEVQRRRKVQAAEKESKRNECERRGTEKWIAKTLKGAGGGGGDVTQQQEVKSPQPCGTMKDFTGLKRGEIHPAVRDQVHEMDREPVELESPLGGRYA